MEAGNELQIPPEMAAVLLPREQATVREVILFPIPPVQSGTLADLADIKKYLSTELPNCHDPDIIRQIPTPAKNVIIQLRQSLASDTSSIQISYTDIADGLLLPVWVVAYWTKLIFVRNQRGKWEKGVRATDLRDGDPTIPSSLRELNAKALDTLESLPWTGQIQGFEAQIELSNLATYLTTDWVTDEEINQMIVLLKEDIAEAHLSSQVSLENTFFAETLKSAAMNEEVYTQQKAYRWLRRKGNDLSTGRTHYVATIVHIGGNHFVTVIVDSRKSIIWYGDPMQSEPDDEVKVAFKWWMHFHTGRDFRVRTMPTSTQRDTYSCGPLSWIALGAFFLKDKYRNINATRHAVAEARLEIYHRIVAKQSQPILADEMKVFGAEDEMDDEPFTFHVRKAANTVIESDNEDEASECGVDCADRGAKKRTDSFSPPPSPTPVHRQALPLISDSFDDDNDDFGFMPTSLKRGYVDVGANSPSTSPKKKRARPSSPKKKRAKVSSIREGLELDTPEKKGTLFQFLGMTSPGTRAQDFRRMREEVQDFWDTQEDIRGSIAQNKKARDRENARLRKQAQRERDKRSEIVRGIRSPGGTRKRKRTIDLNDLLEDVDLGKHLSTAVAELSRPLRSLREKVKKETRKPQGRKQKPENAPRAAGYANWTTPFLSTQIMLAGKKSSRMSAAEITKELKRVDPVAFGGLRPSTVQGWITILPNGKRVWSQRFLERIGKGNDTGHSKGGARGIIAKYPDLILAMKARLTALREAKAPVTIVTARAVMLALIMKLHPEILDYTFKDGSKFRASDAFVRKWLHDALKWSPWKATQAAYKLPDDWEEQCKRSFFRNVHIIKEYDIPAALFVNTDQTQLLYAPGDKLTWAETGQKQVGLIGGEEKRALTAVVSVACDGSVLPMQAVYQGFTDKSCPSQTSPCYAEAVAAGFKFVESKSKTYWSNQSTMRSFVDDILAPYFNRRKEELGLPKEQMSLWKIDVWSVHRSEEFRKWMATHHPNITKDYVPARCTSVAQPCDVGIQRPFKLSAKKSYHEDIVSEVLEKIDKGERVLTISKTVGVYRDRSVRWLWNAYNTINDKKLVQKAFEGCKAGEWNLSWECLDSREAKAALRDLSDSDPELYKELTAKQNKPLVLDAKDLPEDQIPEDDEDILPDQDDSDLPLKVLKKSIIDPKKSTGHYKRVAKGWVYEVEAEAFDNDASPDAENMGRGKRLKTANRLYDSSKFWRHNPDESSGSEDDDSE